MSDHINIYAEFISEQVRKEDNSASRVKDPVKQHIIATAHEMGYHHIDNRYGMIFKDKTKEGHSYKIHPMSMNSQEHEKFHDKIIKRLNKHGIEARAEKVRGGNYYRIHVPAKKD